MFKVLSKETAYEYEVFSVKDNKFLVYVNNCFQWQDMSKFRPTELTQAEENAKDTKALFKSQKRTIRV